MEEEETTPETSVWAWEDARCFRRSSLDLSSLRGRETQACVCCSLAWEKGAFDGGREG